MEYQYQAWQAAATAVLNVVAVPVVVVAAVVEAVINPYFFAVVSVNRQADNAHFYFSILLMWTLIERIISRCHNTIYCVGNGRLAQSQGK